MKIDIDKLVTIARPCDNVQDRTWLGTEQTQIILCMNSAHIDLRSIVYQMGCHLEVIDEVLNIITVGIDDYIKVCGRFYVSSNTLETLFKELSSINYTQLTVDYYGGIYNA